MRFGTALLVALGIILGLWIYQWAVRATVNAIVRQEIRDAQQAGRPEAAGLDPETADLSDVDTELPQYMELQLGIADAIAGLWFIWMPLVCLGCVFAAWLLRAAAFLPAAK
jgi:hypothetical protein